MACICSGMATANERIRDAVIRHQIGVVRASGTLSRKIIALLKRTEKELRRKIDRRLQRIEDRGIDPGPETTKGVGNTQVTKIIIIEGVDRAETDRIKARFETLNATVESRASNAALETLLGLAA